MVNTGQYFHPFLTVMREYTIVAPVSYEYIVTAGTQTYCEWITKRPAADGILPLYVYVSLSVCVYLSQYMCVCQCV